MISFVDNFLIFLHNLNVFGKVIMKTVNESYCRVSSIAHGWMQRVINKVGYTNREMLRYAERTQGFREDCFLSCLKKIRNRKVG